jgi:hypothetical protein
MRLTVLLLVALCASAVEFDPNDNYAGIDYEAAKTGFVV